MGKTVRLDPPAVFRNSTGQIVSPDQSYAWSIERNDLDGLVLSCATGIHKITVPHGRIAGIKSDRLLLLGGRYELEGTDVAFVGFDGPSGELALEHSLREKLRYLKE